MKDNLKMFANASVLITGGTGSFGNVLARYLLKTEVRKITIFSRDENKQFDMRNQLNDIRMEFVIGDVRDIDSTRNAMENIDYVFHAAALKQVPSCEFYPLEAIKTNTLGTENVLNAALFQGVKKVVVLSTDKAVYPINVMGMSKALMEKLVIAKSRNIKDNRTVFCCTRYGNVLASRGSVVPFFIEQIVQGNALTITDPTMTRFLMTLESAVDLVLYAFNYGEQGDLFVQKAPGASIDNLAKALIEIFESSNNIEVIGVRRGEKKHESLLSKEEKLRSIDLGNYFRVPSEGEYLKYSDYFTEGNLSLIGEEDYSSFNTRQLSLEDTINMLSELAVVKSALLEKKTSA